MNSGCFKKGHKMSEEVKGKIRQSMIGKNNWMNGKKHSETTRKKRIGFGLLIMVKLFANHVIITLAGRYNFGTTN